ncbi:MAG: PHP domain-containing protein [Spirochaetales bacterium]|nr:PHP domain-containing protein [Spirochaetales bacterium]MBR6060664.1 PHP domain-containing protein [Spirochaetales bacterium]
MIELHCHSNASDGSLTPTALVELAHQNGITDLALTDHDSIAGISEAQTAAAQFGMNIIPGTELSCEFGSGELHIVGLFIDVSCPELKQFYDDLHKYRLNRNKQLLTHLQNVGIDISEEEVTEGCKDFGTVGRPNFARVITQKGYAKNIFAAFDTYLSNAVLTDVKRVKITDRQAIDMIHKAGGIAILAHPSQTGMHPYKDLMMFVTDLKDKGLDGMEVYYNGYKNKTIKQYRKIANHCGLLLSGGSDFHAYDKGAVANLGYYGIGKPIPDELVEIMRNYLKR